MDRKELNDKLIAFCDQAKKDGFPIKIGGTSEAYPGINDTSFTVHIEAQDWADDLVCAEMLDVLVPILWKSTESETRRFIFSLNVYNRSQSMNCHHIMTFQEYEMAC
jgi:hypothetical protein